LVVIDQKVFWLEVSMTNAELMNVGDTRNELLEVFASLLFFEPLVLDNEVE
jgi:hypothetical protein